MRFVVVDIEATDLQSDRGFLLCAGFEDVHTRKRKVIGLRDVKRGPNRKAIDRHLALAIREELNSYAGWIHWNGLDYDTKYINGRLLLCGTRERLKRAFQVDLMWQIPKLRFTSRRLDWVARLLGCPYEKTALDISQWKDAEAEAIGGFKTHAAFDSIVHHCDMDIRVTGWVNNEGGIGEYVDTISKR